MTTWKHYFIPQTLQSALEVLQSAPGSTCLIAGGTDLLLELQQGHHPPVDNLVDVNRIPELQVLEIQDQELVIGAAVPLKIITNSGLVFRHAPALCDASGLVGGPQVRNTATLGGNVSHALPAADGMIALMALNTTVVIASPKGSRKAALQTLFKGPGKSTLGMDEIVVEFRLPLQKQGQASGFCRIMRPQGVALPILNMSLWLERNQDTILDARIAVGPAGPVPIMCNKGAELLKGKVSPAVQKQVNEAILSEVHYRSSPRRASAEYRQHITAGLLEEVFQKTWTRAEVN